MKLRFNDKNRNFNPKNFRFHEYLKKTKNNPPFQAAKISKERRIFVVIQFVFESELFCNSPFLQVGVFNIKYPK